MGDCEHAVVRVANDIAEVAPADWNACANPDCAPYNPFTSHAFLKALETSGCVSAQTGWMPQHLLLEDGAGAITAIMPCYLKGHSQGEYVFDYAWADAYERAGGRYYPKLLAAVPFTPVTGRRFLVSNADQSAKAGELLLSAALELTERLDISSFHANFVTEGEWSEFGAHGLLQRTDQQFHWVNEGYGSFEEFLSALASRKRKAIRRERREALSPGIEIERLTGGDICEHHWDAFYTFYMDTGARKWGRPYLNREFFSTIGQTMADDILLILCRRGGKYIAGALNMIGGDTLYGRYWGCTEHHNCLHFETCYYQGIDFAISRGLSRVEAGAQGEHKLARGYRPQTTYSLHHLRDMRLRHAVSEFLARERDYVEMEAEVLSAHTPFRKDKPESS